MSFKRFSARTFFLLAPIFVVAFSIVIELYFRIMAVQYIHVVQKIMVPLITNRLFLTISFFGYFTVISNIFVGIWLFLLYKNPHIMSQSYKIFKLITLVFITITMIVYNTLIGPYFSPPVFLLKITATLLHVIVPIWVLLVWLLIEKTKSINLKTISYSFPLTFLYTFYVFFQGYLTNYYPYDFIDVNKIGYPKALCVAGVIHIAFLVLAFLFYWMEILFFPSGGKTISNKT